MYVFPQRIDLALRLCVPYGFMGLLFLFSMVSIALPFEASIEAPFLLMALYYWSIYRPTLIPAWLVFLVGIAFDLLSSLPVGIHAFVFVGARWLVMDQRLFLTGQPFVVVWLGFMVVSSASILIQWFLFGLIHLHWTPLQPALMTMALGIFLFPFISLALHMTHKILPVQSGQYGASMK